MEGSLPPFATFPVCHDSTKRKTSMTRFIYVITEGRP